MARCVEDLQSLLYVMQSPSAETIPDSPVSNGLVDTESLLAAIEEAAIAARVLSFALARALAKGGADQLAVGAAQAAVTRDTGLHPMKVSDAWNRYRSVAHFWVVAHHLPKLLDPASVTEEEKRVAELIGPDPGRRTYMLDKADQLRRDAERACIVPEGEAWCFDVPPSRGLWTPELWVLSDGDWDRLITPLADLKAAVRDQVQRASAPKLPPDLPQKQEEVLRLLHKAIGGSPVSKPSLTDLRKRAPSLSVQTLRDCLRKLKGIGLVAMGEKGRGWCLTSEGEVHVRYLQEKG